jgi:hypothetical protein
VVLDAKGSAEAPGEPSVASSPSSIALSPRHAVTIDEDYFAMVERAPEEDFVVRTLAKTMAVDVPLMTGELVIAGRSTRERHPLAASYPLHFRKTYYPGRLRGDPEVEFERQTRASRVLGIPPPIGYSRNVFRSCLLPGTRFDRTMPFGTDPEESNIRHASGLTLSAAAGLWLLAEQTMEILTRLHDAGLTHGDAQLHNFILCYAPLEIVPIDFDMSVLREGVTEDAWQQRIADDLEPLLKIAVFLQCALGEQRGSLAELSRSRLDTLFVRQEPFRRAIADRARLLASAPLVI